MKLEDLEGYQGIKKFAQEKGVMIAITPACDCSCRHCGVKLYQKKNAKELTTVES